MTTAWHSIRALACSMLAALAACGGAERATAPTTGALTVTITDRGGAPETVVAIDGPERFHTSIGATTTLTALVPGTYTVRGVESELSTGRWSPTPPTQTAEVRAGDTATTSLAFALSTTAFALKIVGFGAGAVDAVVVTGPGDRRLTFGESGVGDLLPPGTYTFTARDVVANGVLYRPTPATQTVELAPSTTPTTVTVTFVVVTGSLAVAIDGLPSGTTPNVTVRGPSAFVRVLGASTTLDGLQPGTYAITAEPRTTADGQTIYSRPGTQTANVSVDGSVAVTVSYAPFELAYQQVASGLTSPTYLTAPAGDGRLFVVEQPGRIRIIKGGALLATPFLDISSHISYGGERGLLSMAFDPAYATNGNFFVYFTNPDGDVAVERYTSTPGADVASPTPTPVITIPHRAASNHNGGLVAFGPDGMLYLATGDGGGGGDPSGNAQNLDVLLGKMLRLDVRTLPYTIPPSNPFAGQSGKRGEIWAYGLRNPWRWDFDGDQLYIADVGQDRYEEIDVTPASSGGVNYGWNTMEATHCYQPSSGCSTTGLRLPVTEYDHSKGCSITGGFAYRGAALPEIAGLFFYSDYCTGFLASLAGGATGTSTTRRWTVPNAGNVLSFGEDAAGELYLLSAAGTVQKIVRK